MDIHSIADISGRIIVAICIIFIVIYFLQVAVDSLISWEFIGLVVGVIAGSALHAWGSTRGSVADYQVSNATAMPMLKSE